MSTNRKICPRCYTTKVYVGYHLECPVWGCELEQERDRNRRLIARIFGLVPPDAPKEQP